MSYPDPPQQPQWRPPQPGQSPQSGQPGLPGQGFPPPPGSAPGQPRYPGGGVPGGPPPGGQYAGGYVPPPGGGRNRWLIPTAIGVAAVVMASTVWASVALVDFGGPQPESVLPANSVAFSKVDLSIDGSQAIELLRFVDQLPDQITEELDTSDGDMTEFVAEGFVEVFPEARQADVEEWIGQRVGGATWPTDDEEAGNGSGVAGALALAVTDERLAEEEFAGLPSDTEMAYEVVDGFVLISDSDAALNDLQEQMEEFGPLERDDVFSGDLSEVPSGSLAVAWADFDGLMEIPEFSEEFDTELGVGGASGRATASVRVDGDYLEARMDVFDLEVGESDLSWLADAPGASVEAMGTLPESTIVAVGASGLDDALTSAYEEGIPLLSDSERADVESGFDEIGITLPDDFGGLLGSSTAFGVTSFNLNDFFGASSYGPSEEVNFEYRAVGGDEGTLSDFVDAVVTDPYAAPPGVSSDGDAVVVSRGTSSTGLLADDPVFQQTMQDMDDAVLAGFFDLRQVLTAEVQNPVQWGALGLALSVTDEGRRVGVELRWAPSGGE